MRGNCCFIYNPLTSFDSSLSSISTPVFYYLFRIHLSLCVSKYLFKKREMGKKCIIPGCKSGYTSNKERVSLFLFPQNDELRAKWVSVIPATRINVTSAHSICEKHFLPSDIVRNFVHKDINGKIIANVAYHHPRLAKSAIPSVFPSTSKYSDSESTNTTTNFESAASTACASNNKENDPFSTTSHPGIALIDWKDTERTHLPKPTQNMDLEIDLDPISHSSCEDTCVPSTESNKLRALEENSGINKDFMSAAEHVTNDMDGSLQDSNVCRTEDRMEQSSRFENMFIHLYECENAVSVPSGWIRYTSSSGKKWVAFSTFEIRTISNCPQPLPRKSVLVSEEGNVSTSANGKTIPVTNICRSLECINTVDELARLLSTFANLKLCTGVQLFDDSLSQHRILHQDTFGSWRHKHCSVISISLTCSVCRKLQRSITQRKRRLINHSRRRRTDLLYKSDKEKSQIIALRKILRSRNEVVRRARERAKKWKSAASEMQERVRYSNEQSVIDKCNELNLPNAQQMCIKEIISAAGKKSPHGNRYTEDWMMLCLLMHIRSPAHYRFLLKNEILPLPAPRTIRRYFSVINTKCGFDENFFEVFGKHLRGKSPLEKHGILLLDEISLRASISVCSSTLTYKGLTDFGDMKAAANDVNDKATHGLVLMYKAIADKYTQPIAVFASKGPVTGTELAKIVVKAIILLEKAGAMVHAVVSDGATTNRKMWSDLGISGVKDQCQTSFIHPCEESRKVFVISDGPHLIKVLRNILYGKKQLLVDPTKPPVKWKDFRVLYELDKQLPANLRVCPKITESHLELNTSTKMRVRLATQIFSNSVAKGLLFYRQRGVPELLECESTVAFCQTLNDMFDALNRRMPYEGVTPDGKDMEILETSLRWLDDWESNYQNGLIRQDQFLTRNTAEGLRVTLQATMDMCHYLHDRFGFKYLLTGKINQDSLEQFFGTIRIAAGSNEHPATPTFLQLYKLLSTFSILKPPVAGNCTVTENKPPPVLITITDLKNIYNPERKNQTEEIRKKLNSLIEHENWKAHEIFEHDYAHAPVVECVIYYVTGYLCKQLLRYTKCDVCRNAIRNADSYSQEASAQLVNLKTRGGLIHPNKIFFNLIIALESRFIENCNLPNVYNRTIDDILMSYNFSFPCKEHADSFLSYAIHYYLRLRMRQFSAQQNKSLQKKSSEKRKQAKFLNS